MDTERLPGDMAHILGDISVCTRLELDSTSLLHATFAGYLHEDAFIRVSVSKQSNLTQLLIWRSFYNGHLSESLRRLSELDTPDNASKAAAVRYPKPRTHLHEIPQSPTQEEPEDTNAEYLKQLREDLAFELASPLGRVSYPENLTVYNYIDFLFCPTLCYELEYPRLSHTRWLEVFYKTLAVFGCIFLMVITSEEFILPVLDASAARLHHSNSALDFALIVAETVGRLLFPFMITFLLVFLVIFEYILGAFAELTRKCLSTIALIFN
jgi:sterol O-acyltransferase